MCPRSPDEPTSKIGGKTIMLMVVSGLLLLAIVGILGWEFLSFTLSKS